MDPNLSPEASGMRQEPTLGTAGHSRKHTPSPMGPINLECMLLDCGREAEHLEESGKIYVGNVFFLIFFFKSTCSIALCYERMKDLRRLFRGS